MKIIIKITLAALFIGCLSKMPYAYYQFIRIASLIGFGLLAYSEYELKHYIQTVICVCAAILLNPVAPFYFKRYTWQPIDEVIAALLLIWVIADAIIYFKNKKS